MMVDQITLPVIKTNQSILKLNVTNNKISTLIILLSILVVVLLIDSF